MVPLVSEQQESEKEAPKESTELQTEHDTLQEVLLFIAYHTELLLKPGKCYRNLVSCQKP